MKDNIVLPALPDYGAPISIAQIEAIEAGVIASIPKVHSIEIADEWRRKARGIEIYLRSPEMQRPMLGAQRHIEGRIGQLLGPAEYGGDRKSEDQVHHDVLDVIPNREDRTNFRLLARALNGDCKLEHDEWRKSRRALVALIRERLGLQPTTPLLPPGQFQCIAADPPWQQTTGPDIFGSMESGNEYLAYKQMSVEAICNLKDKGGRPVQDCFADNAHLYLWTINKYVEQSYSVARAWGFEPSTLLTWCKAPRGVGLGGTFRFTTEFILFCRRGHLDGLKIIPTTWFEWPRGRHSEKPKEFYALVESVTPAGGDSRLALFEREHRMGWNCWGDELLVEDQADNALIALNK